MPLDRPRLPVPTASLPTRVVRRVRGLRHRLRRSLDALGILGGRAAFFALAALVLVGILGLLALLLSAARSWATGPAETILALVFLLPALVLVGRVGAGLVGALVEVGAAPRDLLPDLRAPVEGIDFRVASLRGRRALTFHVTFRTDRLDPGDRVEVRLVLFYLGDIPVEAHLPRYRSPGGHLLVRELSDPVDADDDLVQTVGLLVPLRGIRLPESGAGPLTLDAAVTLHHGAEVVGRARRDIEFLPLGIDRVPEAPEVEPSDEVRVTGAGAGSLACPVCGDALEEARVTCSLCEAPHHPECWRWAGRCSTYACGGGPDLQA